MEISLNKNTVLALVIVAAAGVAGWMYFGQRPASIPAAKPDLMAASPLGENAMGNADAPVTVVEYASLTCPHCANFHEKFFPDLKKRFIDTGKVRFIFREFPRDELDLFAYMLARCVSNGNKDKYFAFVGTLFEQQEKWVVRQPLPPLTLIAKQAGFTEESIEACSKDKKVQEGVEWSGENGSKLGVDSTPTFFLNGTKFSGNFEDLSKAIAALIKE